MNLTSILRRPLLPAFAFLPRAEREAVAAVPVKPEKPVVGYEELLAGGDQLIRDERGVRLARGGGEEAD